MRIVRCPPLAGGLVFVLGRIITHPSVKPVFGRANEPEAWAVTRPRAWGSALCALACILLLSHIASFVCFFYPGIPAVLGGGKPVFVRLLLKEAPAASPATTQPASTDDVLRPETPGGRVTAPWVLVAQTEKSFILLGNAQGEAIELSRDAVSGIRFLGGQ